MPRAPARLLVAATASLAAVVALGCAATSERCHPGDSPPWNCIPSTVTGGPLCPDGHSSAICVDSSWACPFDLVPDREHRCLCFDGPRPPSQHCTCGDGGLPACTFDCGERQCEVGGEYCAVTASDVGGEPDTTACRPFTADCSSIGCDCVEPGSIACESDTGSVTARYAGG